MKCKKHPTYKAVRPPTADCNICVTMWRISRLPRWAQGLIATLERSRDRLQRELAVEWQDEPTEYCIARMDLDTGGEKYLPLETCDSVEMKGIRVGLRDGLALCYTERGRLTIVPQSSNAVRLRREDW